MPGTFTILAPFQKLNPRTLPYKRLGVARLAGGEIGSAFNGDPGVAFALVYRAAYAQVKARAKAASGPQVEEQERPLETRAHAAWREHPEQAVDEAKAAGRVAEGGRQRPDLSQRSARLIEGEPPVQPPGADRRRGNRREQEQQ